MAEHDPDDEGPYEGRKRGVDIEYPKMTPASSPTPPLPSSPWGSLSTPLFALRPTLNSDEL